MKIDKRIVSKIEGEATLKIERENGIVKFVEIEFWQYRGVEEILINKHFMDALVINPRICGICGHSHLLATAKAIEDALNIEVTNKAKILREITTGLEIIQNHIKWFYITLFPTLIKDKSKTLKTLQTVKKINKAIAIIAGQYPHNSYIIPGGVTSDIGWIELLKVEEIIKEVSSEIEFINEDFELFFEKIDKSVGKGLNRFLVLGENLYFVPNGDISFVREENSGSLSKNVLYKNEFVEVGPLARNLERVKEIYEKYTDSIYTRVYARIKEIFFVSEYLLSLIEEIDLNEKSYLKFNKKSGSGISVIEAPRGPLIHQVEIENEKIKKYNIIVPTQFNLSSSKKTPSAAQQALINEKIEYIDPIFKCFDICAVCVSH